MGVFVMLRSFVEVDEVLVDVTLQKQGVFEGHEAVLPGIPVALPWKQENI